MSTTHWKLAALTALGFTLASASAAPAALKGVQSLKNATKHATSSASAAVLHQAHTLLANANHDYDGHRAKAAAHVAHAIRELGGHHAKAAGNGGANKAAGNGAKIREPQAQSDAQLKQAMALLSGVRANIPNTHKAAGHVQLALTELNTALKIR